MPRGMDGSHLPGTRSGACWMANAHRMGRREASSGPWFLSSFTHSFCLQILAEHLLWDRCCGRLNSGPSEMLKDPMNVVPYMVKRILQMQ